MIHQLSLRLVLITLLCQNGRAATEKWLLKVSTNDCVCPGDIVTYECTVFGGTEGLTVWKGDFFHCSTGKKVIELVHRQGDDFNSQTCNDGNVVGRIVRVENGSFISQLNVTLTYDIAGRSIECISDNGTNTERVGSMNLISAMLPLPPENISWLITNNQQLVTIIFMWSVHAPVPRLDCRATYYKINASRDCGNCPTTTNHTTIACTDIQTDGSECMFAVQAVVCGAIGELSHHVSVQVDNIIVDSKKSSSKVSPALVSAIILGIALAVSLVGFTTVTILLIKAKAKLQTAAAAIVTLDKIASERDNNNIIMNRSHDITTNENIAYVVHS